MDLMKKDSIELAFEPARLELKNYDELKKMVKEYSDKYDNLVFQPDDKRGLTQARSELLALRNALEEKRKEVKFVYNEPLDEFEGLMKDLTGLIDKPLEDVREGIKAIDDAERESRKEALNSFLRDLIGDEDVSIQEIEKEDRWLNKGNWTKDLKPKTGQFESELENAVAEVVNEKKRMEREKEILISFCETNDIEPEGWLGQLENKDALEIISDINEYMNREKENNVVSEGSEDVEDKSSSEGKKPQEEDISGQIEDVSGYQTNVITNTIQVTGTPNQLRALNRYLVESGILVVQVSD